MDTKTSPLALLADPGLLRTDALIGGEWVAANDTSARFAVTDPATGAELAQVANCGPVEAAAAISAAERAWPLWRAKTAKEAQTRAYEAVDRIDWQGGFCRRDIGWRVL